MSPNTVPAIDVLASQLFPTNKAFVLQTLEKMYKAVKYNLKTKKNAYKSALYSEQTVETSVSATDFLSEDQIS